MQRGPKSPPIASIAMIEADKLLLVSALINHFAALVYAFWRYVVTQVNFTSALLNGQSVTSEGVVRTAHVTGGTGFFVLLNSHTNKLLNVWVTL
ncbi:conserved protein of unknown function [Pseudomonas marincola]|uniref:Uncharacterized protein n=1 Tax=Pseudomonas marincola TaxID=437900 RepID=A0A8S2B9S8_9PSED|nr:conserved protein of unknown function [Pseudomonas marincola]